MSDRILAVIDPEGDLKEQLQAVRENFLAIQKRVLGSAAQVLVDYEFPADLSISNTTFDGVGALSQFVSSGGLILIFAQVSSEHGGTGIYSRIVLDGEGKAQSREGAATSIALTTTLVWAGTPGKGAHTVDVQVRVAAGSATLYGGDNLTTLKVIEVLT